MSGTIYADPNTNGLVIDTNILSISGDLYISGDILNDFNVNDTINCNNLNVTNDLNVANNLYVKDISCGSLNIDNDLNVTNDLNVGNNLYVRDISCGSLNIDNDLNVTNDLNVGNNLYVRDISCGSLNDNSGVTINKNLIVKNDPFWHQLGQDIIPNAISNPSGFGHSVSLNSSGDIVAIGAYKENTVRVYEWTNQSWILKGDVLTGNNPDDQFGISVSLDESGNTLAIGAPNGINLDGRQDGYVKVYEFIDSSWVQFGNDINNYLPRVGSNFGHSVSLTRDNETPGQIFNPDTQSPYTISNIVIAVAFVELGSSENYENAAVQVFRYYNFIDGDTSYGSWGRNSDKIIVGLTDNSFGSVVLLNGNGTRLLVKVYTENNTSLARMYEFNGIVAGIWTQKGNDVTGHNENDFSISLNYDGTKIALCSLNNDNPNVSYAEGKVYTYIIQTGTSYLEMEGNWEQYGNNINILNSHGHETRISLNAVGDKVALGTCPSTGGRGLVGIYEIYQDSLWVQVGEIIYGKNYDDRSFLVSLNNTGDRIAIGNINDTAANQSVRLYKYHTDPIASLDSPNIKINYNELQVNTIFCNNIFSLSSYQSNNGESKYGDLVSELTSDHITSKNIYDLSRVVPILTSGLFKAPVLDVKASNTHQDSEIMGTLRSQEGLYMFSDDFRKIIYASQGTQEHNFGQGGYINFQRNSNGIGSTIQLYPGDPDQDTQIQIKGGTIMEYDVRMSRNLTVNGNFSNSSDDRLKYRETAIDGALPVVRQLRPLNYDKAPIVIDDATGAHTFSDPGAAACTPESGFVAQDILSITDLTHLVDGGDVSDNGVTLSKPYSLNYIGLLPWITKALQELDELVTTQQTTISSLQTTIASLQTRITALEN